jgi:DNA-binding MarR family transcriptional regulator
MSGLQKNLSDADYARLADFRYALRRFLEFSANAASGEGLTPRQHQAMLVIRGSEGARATVGRLAERLCLKPNTAAELAKRLESGGWITRESGENDRRTVVLALTPSAEATLERLSRAHHRELRQIGPEMAALFGSLAEEAEK